MSIQVDIEGDKELIAKLEKIGAQAAPAMKDIANATAIELRGNIIKKIQRGPKTGAIYQRGNVTHQASKPGQPPATDTGRLVNSIYFDRARGFLGAAVATVGSKIVYAMHLEYGTRNMRPRPVWAPEARKANKKFIKRIRAYLNKVTK